MIRNISRKYFEIWGTEEAQNALLKGLLAALAILFAIQSIGMTALALRKPGLIAISPAQSSWLETTGEGSELVVAEEKRAIRRYVELHYNWDSASFDKATARVSKLVSERFAKQFMAGNAEQARFSQEKRVSLRSYISGDIQMDPKADSAQVFLDRIVTVEGLRAVSPVKIDLKFEVGPRTEENPEGVYISDEHVTNLGSSP